MQRRLFLHACTAYAIDACVTSQRRCRAAKLLMFLLPVRGGVPQDPTGHAGQGQGRMGKTPSDAKHQQQQDARRTRSLSQSQSPAASSISLWSWAHHKAPAGPGRAGSGPVKAAAPMQDLVSGTRRLRLIHYQLALGLSFPFRHEQKKRNLILKCISRR